MYFEAKTNNMLLFSKQTAPISSLSLSRMLLHRAVVYDNPTRFGNRAHVVSISIRRYLPAGYGESPKHDVVTPTSRSSHITIRSRSPLIRFLNPWIDMANVTDDAILAFKVESVTRTFGVVAALMCSLSAAALAVAPEETTTTNGAVVVGTPNNNPTSDTDDESNQVHDNKHPTVSTRDFINNNEQEEEEVVLSMLEYILKHTHPQVAGTSLLVHWGAPPNTLSDIYSASCAASFYTSVCAMGLSAVLNAWLGCTPAGGTQYFVRYHSLLICSIPGLLALSTGLAGVALFIGLDRSKGTPISYIGLGGTILGGMMISFATIRGMTCTYRLLTPLIVTHKNKI